MYTTVYSLAFDGHVGRSRLPDPAPLYFLHVLCFHFCVFLLFFYLHAHGGSVPGGATNDEDLLTIMQKNTLQPLL